MMTSDYPDPSFSGDFLPVERVSVARGENECNQSNIYNNIVCFLRQRRQPMV